MAEIARKRRWMPVVLGVSLAINLAVVAAVSGAAWRHSGGEKGVPRKVKGGAIYMDALPREQQKDLHRSIKGNARADRVDPAQMVAVMRQEPFDPSAAARLLDADRDAGLMRMEAISTAWLAQVSAMTTQERNAYADRLQGLIEKRTARWKERKTGNR